MIKLIKLCFVCCLIFRATFVEAVIDPKEAYEALKDFDAEFWENTIYPYYQNQLYRYQNTFAFLFDPECSITQNVSEYLDPICKDGLAELFDSKYENSRIDFRNADRNINFSNASMLDIISSFYRILQCKVNSRDDEYVTKYIGDISTIKTTEQETYIDPYFLEIYIGKNLYHFCLDYDGDEKSDQPGNSEIRKVLIGNGKESPFAAEYWSSYAELNKSRKFLFNLLLCLEVSRRKVVDPNRDDFEDVFCDLPILGTIVIGLRLMNDQIISMEEFFVTTGKYYCFSGTDREESIKNLLQTYCYYKNFQTVDQFLEEIQRLYKQFVGLKITDRVLYSQDGENFIPAKIQKTKGIENLKRTVKIFSSIRRAINYANDVHIVDIANDDNNFFMPFYRSYNLALDILM